MSDSDLEKTEPATPRRKEKAREEGQVARSRELGTFLALICGVGMLWVGGSYMYRTFNGIIKTGLWFDPRIAQDTNAMLNAAGLSAKEALFMVLPIFGLLLVIGVLSSVALSGFLLSGKAIEPKFDRMSPLKGLKRLFGASTLVELVKTLAKAALVGVVGSQVILHYQEDMMTLSYMPISLALAEGLNLVALCCMWISASLILVVLIDVPWQLFNTAKQMRMSKEDVKQEFKESEGDPHVKGRIRSQQRSMAKRRMLSAVPAADVIVTNPTHYAVALKYDESLGLAPKVIAKGKNLIAEKIKEIGRENKVTLLEAPPLARALHHNVEIDQEIPAALYSAVAVVLAWVYQLKNWQENGGAMPIKPMDLEVPFGLDPLEKEK